MKSIYLLILMVFPCVIFAQDLTELHADNKQAKEKKFIFRAGTMSGLNFYTNPNANETSYKRVSIGSGLGAELGYRVHKLLVVEANYYYSIFKNKVSPDNINVVFSKLKLKQQHQMVSFTLNIEIYKNAKTRIYAGTGAGFSINAEQYIRFIPGTNTAAEIGERNYFKFIAPVHFGMDSYIKDKVVLGTRINTFIWGDKKPFRSLNLFMSLGMRF